MADPQPEAGLEVFPDTATLIEAAASLFAGAAAEAVAARGRFVVALSGGSTPRPLYARLAGEPFRSAVPWSHVHVCWGDERGVPPGHPASNYRMAREALLDHVPLPVRHIHRIHGEDETETAAAAYETELRALFHPADGPPGAEAKARFDLVLLGLGHDGHTASLFPGAAALYDRRHWVVATRAPAEVPWRVSLTPMAINAAARVAFLVSGAQKATVLARVLGRSARSDVLPARLIAPTAGRVRWLVDQAAAAAVTAGVRQVKARPRDV